MDPTVTSSLAPTFFFEQTSLRRTPKRYKKQPEELPQDLRFAYVTPRVAVYLAEKEKELPKINEKDTDFGDGLGSKSLLPQISAKVTLLQNQLNSTFSNDEDSQRLLFDRAKSTAGTVIQQLSRILYLFEGLRIGIPKLLEQQLSTNYKELTSNVNYIPREWQCPANRDEYLRKQIPGRGEETVRSSEDAHTDTGSISNMSRHTGEDDARSVKSTTEKDSKPPGRSQARSKAGARTGGAALQDIAEDHGEERGVSKTTQQRPEAPSAAASSNRKESREKEISPNSHRPRTRLEKFKSNVAMAPSGTESRASGMTTHRSSAFNRPKHDDMQSIIAESTSDATLVDRTGYWTIIQFQLSSKQCEDKGWIMHPEMKADRERETMLEWATQRLQMVIKQRKEQEAVDKERGRDRPIVLRYYGDSKRDALTRRGAASAKLSAHLLRGEKPDIPALPEQQDAKKVFMTTVSDGSTTLYYPSGLPAVVTSCCPVRPSTYYTLVFDDTVDRRMLAVFTPSGRGCCYHKNGAVRFLATEREWTMAEENGAVNRRSKWPSNGLKMPAGITVQLNSYLMLKCASLSNMFIVFNAVKETAKVSVGATAALEEVREDQVLLLSGLSFTSQTAKEFLKPQKPKSTTTAKIKVAKGSKGKSKQPPEIQKLLEMPEPTENDADADKSLYRLQRKIKNLVEDWLEHYRIAVGISSPHLRSLYSAPHRRREAQSAKSSPPGVQVIIESLATAVPRPTASPRIPSAPAGRVVNRLAAPSSRERRPASTGNAVKFNDENIEEFEPEEASVVARTTPFPSSAASGSSCRSARSRCAPVQLAMVPDTVWSLRYGSCPVALRQMLLGVERPTCRCSRHKIPHITDIEYDEFIHKHVSVQQLVVISVMSSLFPDATPATEMLDQIYSERNRNRTQPCIQARSDAYRILLYDCATAAEMADHSNPLLLRRHNVVPGMFLIYDNGNLVFCDHIFNGYGSARKDFQKQMMMTRRLASMGRHLPKDFKFSPQKGRSGPRAAWGGEIGGAGVDRHGNAGISLERVHGSTSSLSSGESKDMPIDYHLAGLDVAARFINVRVTASGISVDQHLQSEPAPAAVLSAKLGSISA